MDSVFYVTVYDVAGVRTVGPLPAVASLVVVVAAAVVLIGLRRGWLRGAPRPRDLRLQVMCWSAIIIGSVGFSGFLLGAGETRRLQQALADGRYDLVEGRMENFEPGDRGGHREERFSVRSGGEVYRYRYSYPAVIAGFHASAGPLRAGMAVRIADVRGAIARLEVRQGPGEPELPHRYRRYDLEGRR